LYLEAGGVAASVTVTYISDTITAFHSSSYENTAAATQFRMREAVKTDEVRRCGKTVSLVD
jgi:hypothetical protein